LVPLNPIAAAHGLGPIPTQYRPAPPGGRAWVAGALAISALRARGGLRLEPAINREGLGEASIGCPRHDGRNCAVAAMGYNQAGRTIGPSRLELASPARGERRSGERG